MEKFHPGYLSAGPDPSRASGELRVDRVQSGDPSGIEGPAPVDGASVVLGWARPRRPSLRRERHAPSTQVDSRHAADVTGGSGHRPPQVPHVPHPPVRTAVDALPSRPVVPDPTPAPRLWGPDPPGRASIRTRVPRLTSQRLFSGRGPYPRPSPRP